MIGGLIWKPIVIRNQALVQTKNALTEKKDVRVLHRKLGEDNAKKQPH
jgi:hypothetical protein